ncbi:MAG: YraN family protein [Campylobacterales bacterium]
MKGGNQNREIWGVHLLPPPIWKMEKRKKRGAFPPPISKIGKRGEEIVGAFLEERGFQILARRWRWRGGELDLVATDLEFLYIWEVKSSWSCRYNPVERISPLKRTRLEEGALLFREEFRDRFPGLFQWKFRQEGLSPLPIQIGGAGLCFQQGLLYLTPLW